MKENRPPEFVITSTSLGKNIVDLLAHGILAYMKDHEIPYTPEGFNHFIEISRQSGEKARLAYNHYDWSRQRMSQLFNEALLDFFRLSGKPLPKRLPTIDRFLDAVDPATRGTQAFASEMLRMGGPKLSAVLGAFSIGDCQRDLVWQRMQDLLAQREGDVEHLISEFRERCTTAAHPL